MNAMNISTEKNSKLYDSLKSDDFFNNSEFVDSDNNIYFFLKSPLKSFTGSIKIHFTKKIMDCLIDNTHDTAYFRRYTIDLYGDVTPEIQEAINEFKKEVQLYIKK